MEPMLHHEPLNLGFDRALSSAIEAAHQEVSSVLDSLSYYDRLDPELDIEMKYLFRATYLRTLKQILLEEYNIVVD